MRRQAVEATLEDLRWALRREPWIPEPMSGCWLWTGPTAHKNYGQAYLPNGRRTTAHRAVFQVERGVLVPRDMDIDHLCRNPACVNPAHLEPVTPATNVLRGASPMAQNARKTHCIRGHAYSNNNAISPGEPQHWRRCHVCKMEKTRESEIRRGNRKAQSDAIASRQTATLKAEHRTQMLARARLLVAEGLEVKVIQQRTGLGRRTVLALRSEVRR